MDLSLGLIVRMFKNCVNAGKWKVEADGWKNTFFILHRVIQASQGQEENQVMMAAMVQQVTLVNRESLAPQVNLVSL